jgi:hypothetical protein
LRAHRELFEELDQTVMDALKAASACLIYLWGTRIYTQDELLTLLKEVSDDLLMTAQALTGLAEPK